MIQTQNKLPLFCFSPVATTSSDRKMAANSPIKWQKYNSKWIRSRAYNVKMEETRIRQNTLNLCYKRHPKFFPRPVSKFFWNFPRPCLLFCLLFFCEYWYPVSYFFPIFRSAIAYFKSKWKSSSIFNSLPLLHQYCFQNVREERKMELEIPLILK